MTGAGTSPVTGALVGGAVANGGGLSSNDGRADVGDGSTVGAGAVVPVAGEPAAEEQATTSGSRTRTMSERRDTGPSGITQGV